MPTMVHTMLVRVGSMVCSARAGSTSPAPPPPVRVGASCPPDPALAVRLRAASALMVPSLLFLTIVTRSTGHSALRPHATVQNSNQPILASF